MDTIDDVKWPKFHRSGTIEIVDPWLFPNTVERDALGCLGVYLRRDAAINTALNSGQPFSTAVLSCANTIEAALRDRTSLAPCYEAVENLANADVPSQWRGAFDRNSTKSMDSPRRAAKLFIDMRLALPPTSDEPTLIDEADMDGIAEAIRP
jgi:hypothetical protein